MAGDKDAIDACLSRAVCAGKIGLDEARRRIWGDWRRAGAGPRCGEMMGWRGQANRDEDAERQWRALPLRERYRWTESGVTLAAVAAILAPVFLSEIAYGTGGGHA